MVKKKIYVLGFDQMILPLVQRFAQEGVLPNIAALMQAGAANEAMSSIPAQTPTNWATIASGADTGTHGVCNWTVVMPNGQRLSALNSLAVNAETIWEAAERTGLKSVLIHYPASMPSRLKMGLVVDGYAGPGYGETPFEITPSRGYTTLSGLPNTDKIDLQPAREWQNLPCSAGAGPLESALRIVPKIQGEDRQFHLLVVDSVGQGYDRVIICRERDYQSKIAETSVGEWSDWVLEPFVVEGQQRTGTVRFKLVELSKDGRRLRLYRSQIMPTDGFTAPDELGEELIERFGPYQEYVSELPSILGSADFETCLEEAEYQAQWIAKAGQYLMDKRGGTLFYSHWHWLDDINHHHLAQADPSWPMYRAGEAERHLDILRRSYMVADGMVGLFRERLDGSAYLVVISDHGCVPAQRTIDMRRFLHQRGLWVARDEDQDLNEANIDWEKTKAYVRDGYSFDIYIRAEGEEYERIRDELIRDLRTWVDEKAGRTPILLALKKEDAFLLGYWGEQAGDIIALFEGGYTWAMSKGEEVLSDLTGVNFAFHGSQPVTRRTSLCSNLATFIIAGPGIKKGYTRAVAKLGYIKLKDIAPTFCHLLDIEPPAQSQGAVAYDLLEGHEMYRERPSIALQAKAMDRRIWIQRDMHDFSLLEDK
ncbi:MAG: alkaline phosphatase family protein [Chloroflexi bacterium]|nr:alkaline phosphatase family protein [Chloroflexota bacterium]